ncbi:hypothetical protein C8R45DRAFT_1000097 [Mycena sanguinolenta]|nr:hypothetical protein C8R45DRAFT_1000097 [Mycena sanguinolenta]
MQLSTVHFVTILCFSLLCRGSLIPLSRAEDVVTPSATSSLQYSSASSISATTTLSPLPPFLTFSAGKHLHTFAGSSRPPRPSWSPKFPNKTGRAISSTGIILLCAFLIGLVAGLAMCARSYWRTPHRAGSPPVVRGHADFDAQWLDMLLGGQGLLRPPPPPYFPRPPSYDGARSMPCVVRDDSAVRSLYEWETREHASDPRRHSV